MLKISAIVLVALVVVVVSGGGSRPPPQQTNAQETKNGKHNTNPIFITSIILRSMVLQIFTDRRSCGNDFNTRILYHCKWYRINYSGPTRTGGKVQN